MDESKDKHGIGHPMDRSPADMETDDCSTAPDAQQQTPAKDSSATDPCEQKPKLGIPDPKPTAQRPLTPDELAERKEEEEAELQSKFEEEQAELEARGVWHVPRALRTVLVC